MTAAAERDALRDKAQAHAQQKDWAQARQSWDEMRARFPDEPGGHVGAAAALRQLGQLDEADRLLDETAGRFEDRPAFALERARIATARRDWQEAARRWQLVRECLPDNPVGYARGGSALRQLGRLDEAEELLGEAAARFSDNEPIALERARVASARRNWPQAASRWREIAAQRPDEPQTHLALLAALDATGEEDEAALAAAAAALSRARAAGGESDPLDRLELAIAQARKDWPAVRRVSDKLIAGQAAPPIRLLSENAAACWQLRDLEGTQRSASRVLARNPADTHAALLLGWVATESGDGEKALAYYRSLAGAAPDNPRWAFETARMLNFLGRIEESNAEIERARARWPEDPQIGIWMLNHGVCEPTGEETGDSPGTRARAYIDREMRQIIDLAPKDEELRRPLVADAGDRDVILGELQGAETAIIVFTGPHDHVTLPLAIFDRYLASFGASAVYVKDFHRLTYVRGVRSLGDREQSAAALREIALRLGARRFCTIGVDTGGAIGYGVRLEAERILCFGVPTTTALAPVSAQPARMIMQQRLRQQLGGARGDLRVFLQRHPHGATIDLFYSEGMAADKAQSEHLAGLPGVTLHPQPGSEHPVLRLMAKQPGLRDTLARLLGLR